MNVMWFRSDLRVFDNHALLKAIENGPCIALYIATPAQWQQHDWGDVKLAFIERHLNELNQQLAHRNIKFYVIHSTDFTQQVNELVTFCQLHNVSRVFANKEPELNEVERDNNAIAQGVALSLFESDVIVAKGAVRTLNDQMFKVFTPFKKAWLKLAKTQHYLPLNAPAVMDDSVSLAPISITDDKKARNIALKWPLASQVRQSLLAEFIANKHDNYHLERDYPAKKGTSGLSAYLAIGAISVREVMHQLLNHAPLIFEEPSSPAFSWLNELVWRDFYRHLQYHFPQLARGDCFQARYSRLPWQNDKQRFATWCDGRTGYPLVDAAMRQLNTVGWMHNRLRMVTASFLTKHLLVDWHWGERYFMQRLIDGDFSANNGGWQWAASTGCDAQPYFRIFNPITQSEKFDPSGEFIRMYIPELEDVPIKHLHFPHQYLAQHNMQQVYVPPIVEHKVARAQALAFYKD